MAFFSNDVVQLFPNSFSAAVNIASITSLSHNLNNEVTTPETGGPFAETQVLIAQQPVIEFTTESIAPMLANVGLTGLCITPGSGKPGFTAFQQLHDRCATNARASSGHQSILYPNGHLVLNSLSASRNGNASLSAMMHFLSTDTDLAPTISSSATLPTSPTPIATQYALGKPTILGTVIDRVESMTINYNVQAEKINDTDNIRPTVIDPQFAGVSIQIVAKNPSLLGGLVPIGGAYANSNTAIRLIKRVTTAAEVAGADNGAFADFTTSVHILGQVNGFVTVGQHYDASGRSTGMTQIDIACVKGASAPIVWDVTNPYDLTTITPAGS